MAHLFEKGRLFFLSALYFLHRRKVRVSTPSKLSTDVAGSGMVCMVITIAPLVPRDVMVQEND